MQFNNKKNNLKTLYVSGEESDQQIKMRADRIGIDNQNSHAITAGMELLLYYEGILRESGIIDPMCVKPGNRVYGKLNGIYFVPKEFKPEQLKNSDFSFQIESIEIKEIEGCN